MIRLRFPLLFVLVLATALFAPAFAVAAGSDGSDEPGGPAVPEAVGKVLAHGGNLERANKMAEAVKFYREELAKSPSPALYRALGAAMGKMGKYQDAIKVVDEGIGKFAKDTSLLNVSGLLHFRKGDTAAAANRWRETLALDPKNGFATKWLAKVPAAKAGGKGSGSGSGTEIAATVGTGGADSGTPDSGTPSSGGAYTGKSTLPLAEQEKLAEELYKTMSATDKFEIDTFIRLHKQVIEQCCDTERAEESCWRLSNLFLTGKDDPDHDACIDVLEHFVKRYPNSQGVPLAMNRLCDSYKAVGNHKRVTEMYAEMFKNNPNMKDRDYVIFGLDYAKALEGVGNTAEARQMYQNVIAKDNKSGSLEARVAEQRLAGLTGGGASSGSGS